MTESDRRKYRILILDEELPYPLNSGKRLRTYNLLKWLAKEFDLTYLAHRQQNVAEQTAAEAALMDIGIKPIVVPTVIPPKAGPLFPLRLLYNLFCSSLPYSVMIHHTNKMVGQLEKLLQQSAAFDLVHAEWSPYGKYILDLGSVLPAVVMAHNVESLIWKRYAENETNRWKRWFLNLQYRRYDYFEQEIYTVAEQTIAVSTDDAKRIREQWDVPTVQVVDNGVDTTFFAPEPTVPRVAKNLLFLGSLDWRPNVDAVNLLLQQIIPAVLKQDAQATFTIVGRNPPDWLRQSATKQIAVHSNVADVRPYLHQASRLVVPLRIGGGSRLKILEALSTGLPVLSTGIGAEGLHLQPDLHYTRADTVEELTQAILQGFHTQEQLQAQADAGKKVVLQQYDWEPLAQKLKYLWLETIVRGPNHLLFD